MKKLWRIARWPLAIILILFVLVALFNPIIIRYAINNYSEEYTGRKITVQDVDVNLFNGKFIVEGLNIKEADDQTDFADVASIMVNLSLYKAISGFYEVTELHVQDPQIKVVQDGEHFNFDDLILRFTSEDEVLDTSTSEPVEYSLSNFLIENGTAHYSSDLVPEDLMVERLSLAVEQISSADPNIHALIKLFLGWGGEIASDIRLNMEQETYIMNIQSLGTQLGALKVYATPYMDLGTLDGQLNTDLDLKGSFNDPMDLALKGAIDFVDFEVYDPREEKLAGIGLCSIKIDSVNIKNEVYDLDHFAVHSPFVHYEVHEDGDNFTKLMKMDSNTVQSPEVQELGYDPSNPFSMLTHYSKGVIEDYKNGSYKVDSLELTAGEIKFRDYTLVEPFGSDITELKLTAYDINSSEQLFEVNTSAVLNENGSIVAQIQMDPNALSNMTIDCEINSVGMPVFGPYSIFYTALPILDGHSKYVSHTVILDNKIKSENHIRIEQFQYGNKMKEVDAEFKLPLKLAVALLRDKDGNIDLKLPVEGDLNDPEYRIGRVVLQILKNIIVKCVSAPYSLIANSINADEEDLRNVHFGYLETSISNKQKKALNTVAQVLEQKPELHIDLIQSGDMEMEEQRYALHFAKAMYLDNTTSIQFDASNEQHIALADSVEQNDSLFVAYLNQQVGLAYADLPTQRKCEKLVGQEKMHESVKAIWAKRNAKLLDYLLNEKDLAPSAFSVRSILPQDTIVANGMPKFQMVYSVNEE